MGGRQSEVPTVRELAGAPTSASPVGGRSARRRRHRNRKKTGGGIRRRFECVRAARPRRSAWRVTTMSRGPAWPGWARSPPGRGAVPRRRGVGQARMRACGACRAGANSWPRHGIDAPTPGRQEADRIDAPTPRLPGQTIRRYSKDSGDSFTDYNRRKGFKKLTHTNKNTNTHTHSVGVIIV